MRISLSHVPFEQAIAFIQTIYQQVESKPALADALEGVFERLFLDTMLSYYGDDPPIPHDDECPMGDIWSWRWSDSGEEDEIPSADYSQVPEIPEGW